MSQLKNQNDINLIIINGDLHDNALFRDIINSDLDLDNFFQELNKKYFNYIQSYRGDYYIDCLKSSRGQLMLKKLNIRIAVSNYQGT